MLIIMAGLPASGKTTVARDLARRIGGVHVRIDTIEQAIVRAGLAAHPVGPVGYVVGYAVAEDNLRLGATVVADSVNPLAVTRQAWRDVAGRAGTGFIEVEVVCTDPAEHRRRAERRSSDIAGLTQPTWAQITSREYEPWQSSHVVVDTAGRPVDECVDELVGEIARCA